MSSLNVKVVNPERVLFEGKAASLVAPAWDGKVGVLPSHAPFLTLLGEGEVDVDLVGGGSARYPVSGGVLKVLADEVIVLTESGRATSPG